MRSTPRSMSDWRAKTAHTGSSASTRTALPAAISTICRKYSKSRRSSICTWCKTLCPSATVHNVLSVDMWEAIPVLLAQAEVDESVRLLVFSGAGEKAFVSGADISQFEDMRAAREAVSRYEQMAENALMRIYRFSKPTLACIR